MGQYTDDDHREDAPRFYGKNGNNEFLETENEKLKNKLKEQEDKNKSLLEDINKKPVEVPKTNDNSRKVL